MKAYRIFMVAALLPFGWCYAEEPKDYPVRAIPIESEKFKTIFATVAAEQMAAVARVRQKMRVKIVQNIEHQRYLARLGEQLIAVDLVTDRKFVDDTWIEAQIEDTGEIYEYLAVLGNKKSIHLYREMQEPHMMTVTEFVERLKKGESFLVRIAGKQKSCGVCAGTGKIGEASSTNVKSRSESRCMNCSGSGWIYPASLFRVLW
jgi:hypothetical protein